MVQGQTSLELGYVPGQTQPLSGYVTGQTQPLSGQVSGRKLTLSKKRVPKIGHFSHDTSTCIFWGVTWCQMTRFVPGPKWIFAIFGPFCP